MLSFSFAELPSLPENAGGPGDGQPAQDASPSGLVRDASPPRHAIACCSASSSSAGRPPAPCDDDDDEAARNTSVIIAHTGQRLGQLLVWIAVRNSHAAWLPSGMGGPALFVFVRPALAEIHLRQACSCQEMCEPRLPSAAPRLYLA